MTPPLRGRVRVRRREALVGVAGAEHGPLLILAGGQPGGGVFLAHDILEIEPFGAEFTAAIVRAGFDIDPVAFVEYSEIEAMAIIPSDVAVVVRQAGAGWFLKISRLKVRNE